MDSTRAPVPSERDRLGAYNSIRSQRPYKMAAVQTLAFCIAVTALIIATPPQQSPAKVLPARGALLPGTITAPLANGAGHEAAQAPRKARAKLDVWEPGSVKGGATDGTRITLGGRPGTAISHYVKTTKAARLSRLGCREGKRLRTSTDPDGSIVVLDFGRPTQKGRGRGRRWGASLFRRGFHSTSAIGRAAQVYGEAAWRCMGGRKATTHLTVAIGTSNFGRAVTFWHGRAWARMVNLANSWSAQKRYMGTVRFAGANDIELSWSSPRRVRAWVRGYDSEARWPYYDYGDAAACPPRGNCLGAWTIEDVWYVAWGARSARPLPEVYTPNGIMAEQWYRLSLYSFRRHGQRMWIAGVMSQRTACRQSKDPCRGMNNSPARAWHLLHRALNRDHRTAQVLHWSTDIAWVN